MVTGAIKPVEQHNDPSKAEPRVAFLERHLSNIVIAACDVLQAEPDQMRERLDVLSDAVAAYDDEEGS